MSIFKRTRKAIEDWLQSDLKDYPKDTRIAVFGAASYARFIAETLPKLGYDNILFTVSYPRFRTLDGLEVMSIWDLEASGVELVLSGSLSNTEGQRDFIREEGGVQLPFLGIADGKTLCVEPREDRCDPARLASLHNRHEGERFYVIANGPSLNETPPEAIADGIRLAANGIVLREGFCPDYYFMIDQVGIDLWESQVLTLEAPVILASHIDGLHQREDSLYRFPVCFSVSDEAIDPYEAGVPVGGTVVNAMMYFAAYMGASEIVIIGLDNNYHGQQTHFSEAYRPKSFPELTDDMKDWWAKRQAKGIWATVEVLQKRGVRVMDATAVDNRLGLERCPFHALTGRPS